MKRTALFAAFLAGFCLISAKCYPQEESCAGDAQKFCADIQPGGGRIIQCLKKRDAELSAGCKESIRNMRPPQEGRKPNGQDGMSGQGQNGPGGQEEDQGREQMKACEASAVKFCKDIEPGEGRIIQCLKKHNAELPAKCKAVVKTMRLPQKGQGGSGEEQGQGPGKDIAACKANIEAFCKDIEPGGGRIIQCLKTHESELSAECKKTMKTMSLPQKGQGGKGGEPGRSGPGMRVPGGNGAGDGAPAGGGSGGQ